MKKTGIIVAMKEELEEILKVMNDITKKEIYNIQYFEGSINKTDIVIVEAGVGKVNAARVTQILIDKLEVKEIINVGSAGALDNELNIGDIVIADKLVQHDFDITAFNHNKGYITGVGEYIKTDKILIEKFKNSTDKIENRNYKIKVGTIASGDIFCTDTKMKDKIRDKFNADCVEMEGAAIAQVCYLDKISFIVIRSISDTPNGNNAIVFDKFVKLASKRCSEILLNFFK